MASEESRVGGEISLILNVPKMQNLSPREKTTTKIRRMPTVIIKPFKRNYANLIPNFLSVTKPAFLRE